MAPRQFPLRAAAETTRHGRHRNSVTHTSICRPCADDEIVWGCLHRHSQSLSNCSFPIGREPSQARNDTGTHPAPPQPHSRLPQAYQVTTALCPPSDLRLASGRPRAGCRACWPVRSTRDRSVRLPNGLWATARGARQRDLWGESAIERVAHPFKVRAPQPSSIPVPRPTANQNRVTRGLQFANASL
jgi:hypothetical protein